MNGGQNANDKGANGKAECHLSCVGPERCLLPVAFAIELVLGNLGVLRAKHRFLDALLRRRQNYVNPEQDVYSLLLESILALTIRASSSKST